MLYMARKVDCGMKYLCENRRIMTHCMPHTFHPPTVLAKAAGPKLLPIPEHD
jgi:hypothetical protein